MNYLGIYFTIKVSKVLYLMSMSFALVFCGVYTNKYL